MSLFVDIEKKLDHMTLRAQFEVSEKVFSLFGASGSGKSMILKCIAGIETPDYGKIVLNDRVLFDSENRINLKPQLRKVGYAFQHFALFPNLTVEQNIGIAVAKRERRKTVAENMELFCLNGLEKVYPQRLSGGQKQRVSLARMFASKPEAILLDEPFSALDHQLAWDLLYDMKGLLRRLQCPVVFVSHNREEVYQLSDSVAVIDHGHLGMVRDTKDLFQNPKTVKEAILSGCDNVFEVNDGVKRCFGLPAIPESFDTIGFSSDAIKVTKGCEDAVKLTCILVDQVEEINAVRYEFLLLKTCDIRFFMRKPKAVQLVFETYEGKKVTNLYLQKDAIHLLRNEGELR